MLIIIIIRTFHAKKGRTKAREGDPGSQEDMQQFNLLNHTMVAKGHIPDQAHSIQKDGDDHDPKRGIERVRISE